MTADARFSSNLSGKLTYPLLFTIRVVQHCAAISATAELLQNVIIAATFISHGISLVLQKSNKLLLQPSVLLNY